MEREGYVITDNTLKLADSSFSRSYDDRYMIALLDQGSIRGIVSRIHGPNNNTVTVKGWTDANDEVAKPKPLGVGLRVDLAVTELVKGKKRSIGEVLIDVITSLIPRNLFKAMANNDVLPLIIFSLVFGAVLLTLGERGRPVIRLFEGLNEAVMKMVMLLMLAAPVGVGALIAGRLANAGGFAGFGPELARLGKYSLTVILGLLIHSLVILPLVLHFFGKRKAGTYARNTAPALTTAFSTASSSATLPVTIQCTSERNGVPLYISNFVLPLGATINMDGTALYEAVAAIFIAQIYGIQLGMGHLIIIFLTATLAAIGAAAIPQAGLVTMIIVLRAVNLPIEGISLILVIDWFLDRCRTTVNVWGDAVGAAVIERYEGGHEDEAREP
ncbi:MAG: dicarboxylate/amino acid:cation symporter [Candidatus Coatesbacteria bacterium]|nr:dicarboxylate/amino acid:cation symporter [Candidatus Coatesbacteria bacterium]